MLYQRKGVFLKLSREERSKKKYAEAKVLLALRAKVVEELRAAKKPLPKVSEEERRAIRNATAVVWRHENPAEKRHAKKVQANRNRRKRYKEYLKANEIEIAKRKEEIKKKRLIDSQKRLIQLEADIKIRALEINYPIDTTDLEKLSIKIKSYKLQYLKEKLDTLEKITP